MASRHLWGGLTVLLVFFAHMSAAAHTVNQELSNIICDLWTLDTNRFRPGTDYRISPQGRADFAARGSQVVVDHASSPLFSYVDENKLQSITTYARFMKLLDNYERSTGIAEMVTNEEVAENNAFLDAILDTAVMKRAHQYLVQKGKAKSNLRKFKRELYKIWFRLYNRDWTSGADSSGFEHVFVGETKTNSDIMGLHNWVQFYLQEKQKLLDYKGYKARRIDKPYADDHILNVQFSWHSLLKPVGSTFIGVSPEFEMAVFTIFFLTSNEKTSTAVVNVVQYQLELVVNRHGRSIGTCYSKLLSSKNRHNMRN